MFTDIYKLRIVGSLARDSLVTYKGPNFSGMPQSFIDDPRQRSVNPPEIGVAKLAVPS
ncbi:hypothetical protein OMCYN_01610 [cyanobiont of Ornithocercus magnificus]|nr:hypothetical protein OMCYN_01610 [cyanobiont of Ornithocercus magnificus]